MNLKRAYRPLHLFNKTKSVSKRDPLTDSAVVGLSIKQEKTGRIKD